MNIEMFVSETLRQIVAGVAKAQADIAALDVGARVNPTAVYQHSANKMAEASEVKFDLAVTVVSETQDERTSKASGSASGVLAIMRAKVEGELASQAGSAERNEAISRVSFSVMLAQPADLHDKPSIGRSATAQLGRNLA